MDKKLMSVLEQITGEEQAILDGRSQVSKALYTDCREFVIDSKKMLEKGKLMDIRTHTRFVHFPKHKHNYVEIIYMCSGETVHIINGADRVVLHQGELLFLNQNCYHEIFPAGKEDIAVNFIVLPEFFDEAFKMMDDENILRDFIIGSLTKSPENASYLLFQVSDILPVQNLVENMVWSLVNKQPNRRQMNQITMGLLLLSLVNASDRIFYGQGNPSDRQDVLRVLRYIESNYRTASLQELAEMMNESFYQLSRFIKKHTGHTFKELLLIKRLNQAAYLLGTTRLPVADIIYHVGYDNTSYFHRVFKERYKMTPREYRERC
ncbi:MAG: helix-turn-helix domain-containing protein [Clostridiales bacterium]|nr:helix-turn-helix domain-containing protein [Clostridiales bacterium]